MSADAPEGAFITARVEVIQYLHPDSGEIWWNIDHDDASTLTQIIGLLAIAQQEMFRRSLGEQG